MPHLSIEFDREELTVNEKYFSATVKVLDDEDEPTNVDRDTTIRISAGTAGTIYREVQVYPADFLIPEGQSQVVCSCWYVGKSGANTKIYVDVVDGMTAQRAIQPIDINPGPPATIRWTARPHPDYLVGTAGTFSEVDFWFVDISQNETSFPDVRTISNSPVDASILDMADTTIPAETHRHTFKVKYKTAGTRLSRFVISGSTLSISNVGLRIWGNVPKKIKLVYSDSIRHIYTWNVEQYINVNVLDEWDNITKADKDYTVSLTDVAGMTSYPTVLKEGRYNVLVPLIFTGTATLYSGISPQAAGLTTVTNFAGIRVQGEQVSRPIYAGVTTETFDLPFPVENGPEEQEYDVNQGRGYTGKNQNLSSKFVGGVITSGANRGEMDRNERVYLFSGRNQNPWEFTIEQRGLTTTDGLSVFGTGYVQGQSYYRVSCKDAFGNLVACPENTPLIIFAHYHPHVEFTFPAGSVWYDVYPDNLSQPAGTQTSDGFTSGYPDVWNRNVFLRNNNFVGGIDNTGPPGNQSDYTKTGFFKPLQANPFTINTQFERLTADERGLQRITRGTADGDLTDDKCESVDGAPDETDIHGIICIPKTTITFPAGRGALYDHIPSAILVPNYYNWLQLPNEYQTVFRQGDSVNFVGTLENDNGWVPTSSWVVLIKGLNRIDGFISAPTATMQAGTTNWSVPFTFTKSYDTFRIVAAASFPLTAQQSASSEPYYVLPPEVEEGEESNDPQYKLTLDDNDIQNVDIGIEFEVTVTLRDLEGNIVPAPHDMQIGIQTQSALAVGLYASETTDEYLMLGDKFKTINKDESTCTFTLKCSRAQQSFFRFYYVNDGIGYHGQRFCLSAVSKDFVATIPEEQIPVVYPQVAYGTVQVNEDDHKNDTVLFMPFSIFRNRWQSGMYNVFISGMTGVASNLNGSYVVRPSYTDDYESNQRYHYYITSGDRTLQLSLFVADKWTRIQATFYYYRADFNQITGQTHTWYGPMRTATITAQQKEYTGSFADWLPSGQIMAAGQGTYQEPAVSGFTYTKLSDTRIRTDVALPTNHAPNVVISDRPFPWPHPAYEHGGGTYYGMQNIDCLGPYQYATVNTDWKPLGTNSVVTVERY